MPYRVWQHGHWSRHGIWIEGRYTYPWWTATRRWCRQWSDEIAVMLIGIGCMAWIVWLSHQPH